MSGDAFLRFTANQVAAASTAMRVAAGKPPEHFTAGQLLSMLGSEVADLRATGWDDEALAALIRDATGEPLDAEGLRATAAAMDRQTT